MLEVALTPQEEGHLLKLARDSISAVLGGRQPPRPVATELTPGLLQPLGAFVTLTLRGDLRGCIGQMRFDRPLYQNVIESAISAAFHDPRFPPLTAREWPEVRVEISVLEQPRPISGPDEFEPGRHGIVMEVGHDHGVFLPKVAREYGWDRPTTLTMLCRKIGLPDDAWKLPQARFKIYEAREFGDPI